MEARNSFDAVSLNEMVLIDSEQLQARFNLGRQTLDKIAVTIGAKVKVGRRTLYKRAVMDDWADSLSASKPGEKINMFAGDGVLKKDCMLEIRHGEDINGRTKDVCEEGH